MGDVWRAEPRGYAETMGCGKDYYDGDAGAEIIAPI